MQNIHMKQNIIFLLKKEKVNPLVAERFIRGRKLNISCLYYAIIF